MKATLFNLSEIALVRVFVIDSKIMCSVISVFSLA